MAATFLDGMDFSDINRMLEKIYGYQGITFEDLVDGFMSGNFSKTKELLGEYVKECLIGNWLKSKNLFLGILLIGIFSLLVSAVSDLLQNQRVILFSNYFILLCSSVVLMKCFFDSYQQGVLFLDEIKSFSTILMPSFCMVMGVANGPVTATAFYEMQIFLLFLIENILALIAMPLIRTICILYVLNQMPDGNRFDGIISLLRKCVQFLTKGAIFATIITSFFQTAIMPAVDGVGEKAVIKMVAALPGVGDSVEAISESVIRGAVLVKNSIGVAGVVVIALICIRPVIATFMLGISVRMASAILQISGEKRYTGHVWKMADCFFLLTRVMLFSSGVFFVSISVATIGVSVR